MVKRIRLSLLLKATLSVAAAALVGLAFYYFWPLMAPLGDEQYVRQLVKDAGPWGPLVFSTIHAIQVIIAPIPGQVIGLVGGYAFGPVWGTIYAVIGSAVGFAVVLLLARKFGRPFVEKFVSPKLLARFDYLISRAGSMTFFLIFLLPGFPDDLIGFIAGLTKLRLRILLLASVAGRLPGYAVLSVVGHGLTGQNLNAVIAVLVVALILSIVAFWKRAWIGEFVRNEHRVVWAKADWEKNWRSVLAWTAGLGLLGVIIYEIVTWYVARQSY